jgi:CDP-2,3-bis-(O-geranylgeranyl)-sn-glycerol synthase
MGVVITPVNPFACAALLIVAFILAGAAQTAWFAWEGSQVFAIPLDGGLTVRGRRLFGENKTIRGLVVMVPAGAAALAATASIFVAALPSSLGIWPLTTARYAALGAWCALGFMIGELPNSFVKRQLDIAPGAAAAGRGLAWQLAVDRLDSGVGLLVAANLIVSVPLTTWATVLVVGPLFHWSFSVLMFRLGLKPRPA